MIFWGKQWENQAGRKRKVRLVGGFIEFCWRWIFVYLMLVMGLGSHPLKPIVSSESTFQPNFLHHLTIEQNKPPAANLPF